MLLRTVLKEKTSMRDIITWTTTRNRTARRQKKGRNVMIGTQRGTYDPWVGKVGGWGGPYPSCIDPKRIEE